VSPQRGEILVAAAEMAMMYNAKLRRSGISIASGTINKSLAPAGRNISSCVNPHNLHNLRSCIYPTFEIRMQKVEHIGIAVKSLDISISLFEKLLNTSCYKTEAVASENVKTAFFKQGETKIELLESSDPHGVIAKFIEKKGEGLHHIAFDVEDIEAEMERLKKEGFVLLNDQPKPGADNKMVCFLHPKHTNGVLIELCMERRP
jgi:methylmalonyl-CoA/ethylmalonyl-CoA epimerase